jgi:predicted MFS family arabinose efflux permease
MLAVVFVARTSMGFQFQAIGSVGPLLVRDFHIGYAQLGWLTSVYMLPGIVFALPGGVLGQRFDGRRVAVGSLALMAVGAVITARAETFATAGAGRLVSELGAVLINILLSKMVADWFTGRELATAMAVMLTSWPLGLGLAATTLGHVAAAYSWRAAIEVTALVSAIGLVVVALLYRNPVASRGDAASPAWPSARDVQLSASAGFAWGCFNASLVAVLTFGPGLLIARGLPIGAAGVVVSLAIWLTMLSVPLGGYVADRLRRPNLIIAAGSLVTALVILLLPAIPRPTLGFMLVGLTIGGPPGAVMSLLPRTLRSEVLSTGLGIYYSVFYLCMAATQPLAGWVRDVSGTPEAPVVFAAAVMAATVLGLALFRHLDSRLPA